MQQKELVLRILGLNLIPSPRVIVPGPATRFPVLHVDTGGLETVADDLGEAKALSKRVAGSPEAGGSEDFFMEILPVTGTARVQVAGLGGQLLLKGGETPGGQAGEAVSLAVRAAYALGLDWAEATIGFGRGGPWVLDVRPVCPGVAPRLTPRTPVRFLGARAEYIAVDPQSGRTLSGFFHVLLTPEGEMVPPEEGEGCFSGACAPPEFLWISSPYPRREMPLSTRFVFRGKPTSSLLRVLDGSLAILGMMFAPPHEARERTGSGEGLLGSYRDLGDGTFEYTAAPSLLGDPRAMKILCETVSREIEKYNETCVSAGDLSELPGASGFSPGSSPGGDLPRGWAARLEELYRRQRAYYHADKAFFREEMGLGPEDLSSPREAFEQDFRASWGLYVPSPCPPCVTVGSRLSVAPRDRRTGVILTAGSKSVRLAPEDLLPPDPLEAEDFDGPGTAWAPGVLVRPNREAARILALSEDGIFRASPRPGGKCLRIGPVIGIMAPKLSKGGRFGVETDRFRHMVRMGAEMGLMVYVFFPEFLSGEAGAPAISDGVIRGFTYRDRRGWVEETVPVPDVVYDRYIPPVAQERKDLTLEFARAFPQTIFLNSLPFVEICRDKLRAYEVLSEAPGVGRHLPQTEPVLKPLDAVRFASSCPRSFLKPRFGTGTKGLILVENLGSSFRVTRREKGVPPRVDEVSGRDGLLRFLTGVLRAPESGTEAGGGTGPEYIIQEGIDLAPLPAGAGSAFEVRVIYQKGGAGVWLRTGMVVRTNPEAEGFVVPGIEVHRRTGEILEAALPGRSEEIKAEIRRLSSTIPRLLEKASGRGGEVSVDLGIDRTGKPWLIEVNSKPATLFRDIGAFELRRISLLRVINYALALFREGPSSLV